MKIFALLLALMVTGGIATPAAGPSTNPAGSRGLLLIDPSSMPITAGKVTLSITSLQRTDGVYAGEYKLNVFPYFYKNEKGRLAIVVSDESLAAINRGEAVTVIGTATTSGKYGKRRDIQATATPADRDHGSLKVWFTVGSREMTFRPAYHFVEKETTETRTRTNKTNL